MKLRVAAYAVVVDSGRVLLTRLVEGEPARWTLPGGVIDPGEDPADAAVREVFEETGHEVELDELLGVHSLVIAAADRLDPADGSMHALRIVYRAHVVGGELRDEVGGSTDAAAWFDLADVPGVELVELVEVALRMAGLDVGGPHSATRVNGLLPAGQRRLGDPVRAQGDVGIDPRSSGV
jgi:8-oxo-dGTP diphosphatase